MALKELRAIAHAAKVEYKLHGVAVAHRLDEVPISEASVIIVAASEHRKEALEATQVHSSSLCTPIRLRSTPDIRPFENVVNHVFQASPVTVMAMPTLPRFF